MFLVQLVFIGIGTMLASLFKEAKRSTGIGVLVLFAAYILGIADSMTDNPVLRIVSPFSYFKSPDIINNGSISIFYVILSVLLFAAMIIIAFKSYKKRDLMV